MTTKLYVLVTAEYADGDVEGILFGHTGQPLSQHHSSSREWLIGDLTTHFLAQRLALEELYPEGYKVVVVTEKNSPEHLELEAIWDEHIPGWRDK